MADRITAMRQSLSMPPAITATPTEVYAVFSGQINEVSTQRFFGAISAATQNGIGRVHLLFQSYGGTVGDGVALYNFFHALPVDLTIYNAGAVQSIGAIAYLGAKKRKASARAAFMLHRTSVPTQLATATRLHAIAKIVAVDDQRTEAILREHLCLSKEEWIALNHYDLHFSAEEAVRIGLAHEIGEFSPPAGAKLYTV